MNRLCEIGEGGEEGFVGEEEEEEGGGRVVVDGR